VHFLEEPAATMCVSTGPTWGVRPHLGLPRLPVRPDPGPRWGSRPAGEARVRPHLGGDGDT